MFLALKGITCFVTVTVCLIYATRIAWVCGKKCNFKAEPGERKHAIYESFPAATGLYFFGFVVIFSLAIDGFVTIFVCALTSAILLSSMVLAMAMPELKRRPRPMTDWARVIPEKRPQAPEAEEDHDLSLHPRRT